MKFGYARCSTNELKQDIERQKRELKQLGVSDENIYFEYESGTKTDRAELKKLFNIVRAGDTIITTEVSRITRSTKQLCDIIELCKEKKLKLVIKDSITIDCSSGELDTMTKAFLQISGVFAELERNIISERVKSGLRNAKAKGTNSLLKQGAITVTSYKDIVEEYAQRYELIIEHESVLADETEIEDVPVAGKPKQQTIKLNSDKTKREKLNIDSADRQNNKQIRNVSVCPVGVSEEVGRVFDALSSTPHYIDEIADKLNLPPQAVMSSLTELEIFGAAEAVSGGRYIRK